MDIKSAKIELVKEILEVDNPGVIKIILGFLKKGKDDFWNQLTESEKEEIRLGIQQLENDEKIGYDDFIKNVL